MKKVILKKKVFFIGKIDEIIAYLTEIQKEYKTVQEYINKNLN